MKTCHIFNMFLIFLQILALRSYKLGSYKKTTKCIQFIEKKVETLLFRLFSSPWRNNGFHFLMRKLRTSTDCMRPVTKFIG